LGEFGDKFRKAREKKEISLDDVSNVTKIGVRMLRAIEEEHFDQLPGGVFNKGFIRAYAKHLGLNDEEAVSDYLACLRQAQIDAHEVWEPVSAKPTSAPRLAMPDRRRPVEPNKAAAKSQSPVQVEELPDLQLPRAEHIRPPRKNFPGNSSGEIPWRILAVSAIVAVLATILWIRHSHRTTAAADSTSTKLQQSNTAPSEPASVSTSAPALPNQSPNATNVGATTLTNPSPINPHPHQGPQSSATSANSPSAVPATVSAGNPGRAESDDVTTSFTKQAVPNSPATTTAALKLVIRAQETSWISVQADGQTVSQETLIAPAHVSVRASHEIVARIGNAAGVTFLWNGQEIPADGTEAEVKTFVFDSNGVRVIPSTQSTVQGR
jgi:cytoskeletal protein RodZ